MASVPSSRQNSIILLEGTSNSLDNSSTLENSGILITIFVSNISWLTFIAATYYGIKNFSIYQVILGIILSVVLVNLAFARLSLFINSKFSDKNKLFKVKTTIEYLIIFLIFYYIFF